jgi:RNA polymerase sigma-70 factor, ECF subfamily
MLADHELRRMYEQYGYLVHRRCLALVRNPADAEDALQETFLRVRRYGAPQTGATLAWLYTTASRVCFDLMAKRRREEPTSDEDLGRSEAASQGSAADGDRRAVIGAVLRTLDTRTRTIGVLHYLDGYTQEEVAMQTGISRKTIGKKLKVFEDMFRRAWLGRGQQEQR